MSILVLRAIIEWENLSDLNPIMRYFFNGSSSFMCIHFPFLLIECFFTLWCRRAVLPTNWTSVSLGFLQLFTSSWTILCSLPDSLFLPNLHSSYLCKLFIIVSHYNGCNFFQLAAFSWRVIGLVQIWELSCVVSSIGSGSLLIYKMKIQSLLKSFYAIVRLSRLVQVYEASLLEILVSFSYWHRSPLNTAGL